MRVPCHRTCLGMLVMAVLVVTPHAAFAGKVAQEAANTDGEAVFKEHCASCHGVQARGIPAGGMQKAMGIDWKRSCRECTPDLSTVGEWRHDAKWLKAYLRGQKKGRNGLRHNELPVTIGGNALIMKGQIGAFNFSDDEEDALVTWLMTLRSTGTRTRP